MPTLGAADDPAGDPDASGPGSSDPGHAGPGPRAVTFRMFASARAAAGANEVHVAAGPTAEVVGALTAGLPPRFAHVMAASSLIADGHRLDQTSTAPIHGGTIVDVLPPFAGG